MRLVWDIEYDYDDVDVIGVREGLARWWRVHRPRRKPKDQHPPLSHGVVDMSNAITMLDVDTSQFETMLSRVAIKGIEAYKVSWLEDELFPRVWDGKYDHVLWGSWDWDDSPRKPLTHMTLSKRIPYGILMRMPKTGKSYRFIGGDTFECV